MRFGISNQLLLANLGLGLGAANAFTKRCGNPVSLGCFPVFRSLRGGYSPRYFLCEFDHVLLNSFVATGSVDVSIWGRMVLSDFIAIGSVNFNCTGKLWTLWSGMLLNSFVATGAVNFNCT